MQIRLTRVVVSFATPSWVAHGVKEDSDADESATRVVTFEPLTEDASPSTDAPADGANAAGPAVVSPSVEEAESSAEAPATGEKADGADSAGALPVVSAPAATDGAQLKKGCYELFESGDARGDIDQVLYERWQAKRVQALSCNTPQRENDTTERYVAEQRAIEEDMDRYLESAMNKRIE